MLLFLFFFAVEERLSSSLLPSTPAPRPQPIGHIYRDDDTCVRPSPLPRNAAAVPTLRTRGVTIPGFRPSLPYLSPPPPHLCREQGRTAARLDLLLRLFRVYKANVLRSGKMSDTETKMGRRPGPVAPLSYPQARRADRLLTSLEKYLALTTRGTEGSLPLPSTLKKPCGMNACL